MKNYFIISIIILSVVFCQRPERNEIITERHPNGLKKLVLVFEGTGINETLVGKYGFYENGLKSHIEFYNNNKKHGKSIFWNEEGTIIVEGTYKMGMMDGPWTYYHENGTKMGEGSFINGDESNRSESSGIPRNGRIGLWTFWYENGQKVEEMIFKNNNLIGIYEGWFNDGTKKLEYYFNDDGTRDSTKLLTQWYENGNKWFEGYLKTSNDEKNVWIKLYTEWYENGNKKVEGIYKNGIKDGLWIEWFQNGLIKSPTLFDVLYDADWDNYSKDPATSMEKYDWYEYTPYEYIKYYPDIYNFKNGGTRIELYQNGLKARQSTYKDKKKIKYTEWYMNEQKKLEILYNDSLITDLNSWNRSGEKMVIDGNGDYIEYWDFSNLGNKKMEGAIVDSYMSGEWIFYWLFNDQILAKGEYINGDITFGYRENKISWIPDKGKEGLWVFFYENGQMWIESTYKDGKLDGLITDWYKNGQKKSEITYKDGKLDGLYTSWHKNGQKKNEGYYEDDKLISERCWDDKGNECARDGDKCNWDCKVW